MSQNTPDAKVYGAIQKLWSSDDLEIEAGKKKLLQIGEEAIPPLITILRDLIENHYPRFPLDKQEQGEKAWKRAVQLFRRNKEEERDERERLRRQIYHQAINRSLIRNVVFLLGKLKAAEAIPQLLKIMQWYQVDDDVFPNQIRFELIALFRIGKASVPGLLRALKDAETIASHMPYFDFPFEELLEPVDDERMKSWLEYKKSAEYEKEEREEIEYRTERIQNKAVLVLSELRDEQALPVLKELLKKIDEDNLDAEGLTSSKRQRFFLLIWNLKQAIDKIEGLDQKVEQETPNINLPEGASYCSIIVTAPPNPFTDEDPIDA